MKKRDKVNVFWFRRDLRLNDNIGLSEALKGDLPVLPVFIFDTDITDELPEDDARISFIYEHLTEIDKKLRKSGSGLLCQKGKTKDVWIDLLDTYEVGAVFCNEDYEPFAISRDEALSKWLNEQGVDMYLFKDQVIFAKNEVMKPDGSPYTVFTPYKKQWVKKFDDMPQMKVAKPKLKNCVEAGYKFPSLGDLGFKESTIKARPYDITNLDNYAEDRSFPARDKTSYLSVHLRFGTVSIREIVEQTKSNEVFLSELIWREFFMQILYHFPKVVTDNFKAKYDSLKWRNDEDEFEKWKKGETGYPLVDAGMRELNATGYLSNRVRLVVAGFLCKHLLIDWRWGEAYFAEKLLDYELSSNNGNWQWCAGTGSDAAPYFRLFNPMTQAKKFDPKNEYISKWIPSLDPNDYPEPMVDHNEARERALLAFKVASK